MAAAEIGDSWSYEKLEEVSKFDIRKHGSIISRARKKLLKNNNIWVENIVKYGYRILKAVF